MEKRYSLWPAYKPYFMHYEHPYALLTIGVSLESEMTLSRHGWMHPSELTDQPLASLKTREMNT